MTTIRYIEWAASVLFGTAVILGISRLTDKIQKLWLKVLIFILKFILMTGLALLLIAYASPFLWKYNYPLSGIYIALLADCICDIVMAAVSLFRKKQKFSFRAVVFCIITLLVSVYGTVNSQIIRKDHREFSSAKLKQPHTFVFLSDLHYGSSQRTDTIEKALDEIRDLHPEFVVLGGDICDEHTEKDEMELIFRQLGSLETPVYYIYGNHDRQDRGHYVGGKKYSEDELAAAIENSGITILQDDVTQIGTDLVLIGREDSSRPARAAVKDLPEWSSDAYVICTDHSPYMNEDILAEGADLQLSGHTHAGQYFPLKYVYTLAGLSVYDTYRIGDTDLYVSPGIGGWYMPFRNEAQCSYTVIELKPE